MEEQHRSVVVIGAGQAGLEVASNLRTRGWAGPITVIGDEPDVPYQRPPLSKAFLKSGLDQDVKDIVLRPLDWYERNGVDLRLGVRATSIDRARGRVELSDGLNVFFDHLVLATGARNRELPISGAHLTGVHYLRTLPQASKLVTALQTARSVAVVGAGFIGLEVAAAAAASGVAVNVFEATERPMARAVSRPISDHFTALHERHGVVIKTRTGVARLLSKGGRVTAVESTSGDVTQADLVVVGIGVLPEDSVASAAGLVTSNGVVVDRCLRTTDPRIFAIGDCASFPRDDQLVRLESVQNAVDHARCVAAQITGTESSYEAVPWFWTEQYDAKLQIAGLIDGHQELVIRGDPESGSFSVFSFSAAGELLGVESVNQARDHMAARRLLAGPVSLTSEQARDPQTDLKDLSRSGMTRRERSGAAHTPA